jgi:tripartite-type tricarboxylate transporter receptor subunit TctC
MKLPRRQFVHLAASAATLPVLPWIARAQTYPTRPVRIIAGFPPGGFIDTTARLIDGYRSALVSNSSLRTGQVPAAT